MGDLGGGGVFLKKILQKAAQRSTKVHIFLINYYVGEMIMNDLEIQMLSYYVIYYEEFKNVHVVTRE